MGADRADPGAALCASVDGPAASGPAAGAGGDHPPAALRVQWNQLPRKFGADSTVHAWFQRFVENGVLEEIWAELVRECDELGAGSWQWQAADGVMGKSRFDGGARGPNPTDRAKMGTRKSVLVKDQGGPLGVVIDGANIHDTKLLQRTIDAIVGARRPTPPAVGSSSAPSHGCRSAGRC